MPDLLRLNLGCGNYRFPGWVNIDNEASLSPDVVADVRQLPFDDGSASEVYASHVLEHFSYDEPVLEEWYRVLAPGGICTVIVPDLVATVLFRNRSGIGWGEMHEKPIDAAYINACVYGGYVLGPPFDREGQRHRQVFILDMLVEKMRGLFPDAADVPACSIRPCELGEQMVTGTKV